ncbi:hypothetical protein [Phyllobacterium phragmitis]|nr:hypothetical protein [Phyllobacterium phragmitis]
MKEMHLLTAAMGAGPADMKPVSVDGKRPSGDGGGSLPSPIEADRRCRI